MSVTEIKAQLPRLSEAERIELLEAVRTALAADDDFPSPAWHAEVLAERGAKIASGDAKFLTIEQLKERLRR